MGQLYFDGLATSIGLIFDSLIEARLLHSKLVRKVAFQGVGTTARVIGLEMEGAAPWHGKRNLGAGDRQPILVNHRKSNCQIGSPRLSAGQQSTPRQNKAKKHRAGRTTAQHAT